MSILNRIPFLGGEDETEDTDSYVSTNPQSDQYEKTGSGVPDVGRFHRDSISPGTIIETSDGAKSGEDYTRTYFIEGWPDTAKDGMFRDLLLNTSSPNDVSIHISPYESDEAINMLTTEVDKFDASDIDNTQSYEDVRSETESYEQTKEIADLLTRTEANLFSVGVYVTVRGDTKEGLEENCREIERTLRDEPALTSPQVANMEQIEGLQSSSPAGMDNISYRVDVPGGVLGAMYPFPSTSINEEGGIEVGMHAVNGNPVFVNQYDANNGYCMFVAGKIGSGKSFSVKLSILRKYIRNDDLKLFMLDPVGGFRSITSALGGREIVIGDDTPVNPMRLNPLGEQTSNDGPDGSRYKLKLRNLMNVFEMYFERREFDLSDARGTLETAIISSYQKKGITNDPETYTNENPTIRDDLLPILKEISQNPEKHVSELSSEEDGENNSDAIRERYKKQAARLHTELVQFTQDGEYSNLGGRDNLDLSDGDVFYFNLEQYEGTGDLGLMMQILLSRVYQAAKDHDGKTLFPIDESHYLMQDAKSLDFLETVVRHSRHHDLGLTFITQEVKDFFARKEAETIIANTAIRQIQNLDGKLSDEIVDMLEMNDSQVEFVRNAQPGDPEVGYSEALIYVDEHGFMPVRIVASEFEESIINFDPSEHDEGYSIEDRIDPE